MNLTEFKLIPINIFNRNTTIAIDDDYNVLFYLHTDEPNSNYQKDVAKFFCPICNIFFKNKKHLEKKTHRIKERAS